MVLKKSEPPMASVQALADMLPTLQKPSGGAIQQRMGSMSSPQAAQADLHPRPLYVLGLDSLLGHETPEPVQKGWQYLVDSDFGAPAAADVASDPMAGGGAAHRFSMLTESPSVNQSLVLGKELEENETADPHSKELRMLRVPALNVLALWLKAEAKQDDSFIALEGPKALPLRQKIEAGDWWRRLNVLALKAVEKAGGPEPLMPPPFMAEE